MHISTKQAKKPIMTFLIKAELETLPYTVVLSGGFCLLPIEALFKVRILPLQCFQN